jgi:hypothetical protein
MNAPWTLRLATLAGTLVLTGDAGAPPCHPALVQNAVRVFASAAAADSATAPLRTIMGPQSALCHPRDLAVDRQGRLYVLDRRVITVYDSGVSGDAAPVRSIVIADSGFEVLGMGLDRHGNLYVGTDERAPTDAGSITVYPRGAEGARPKPFGSLRIYGPNAAGEASPIRVLRGHATRLSRPAHVAFDSRGRMYVANTDGHVTVYREGAGGNAAPLRTIAGRNTLLRHPAKLALAAGDTLMVLNTFGLSGWQYPSGPGYSTVTVYAPDAAGDVEPVRSIVVNGGTRSAGSRLRLTTPTGMAVDRNGSVYVAFLDPGAIAVYQPGAEGDIVPKRLLPGDRTGKYPVGVTVSPLGELYVASLAVPSWDRWWWRDQVWRQQRTSPAQVD